MMRGRRSLLLSALALAFSACVTSDPGGGVSPIEPLPQDERPALVVAEMANESPNAIVAGFTRGSAVLLSELLGNTRRFAVLPGPAPIDAPPPAEAMFLETSVTSFRDEDAGASVVYLNAQSANRKRRAVVEVRYRLRAAGGAVLDEGAVSGAFEQLDVRQIAAPTPDQVATGAYWNTPFGRATRECLDAIVRRLATHRP